MRLSLPDGSGRSQSTVADAYGQRPRRFLANLLVIAPRCGDNFISRKGYTCFRQLISLDLSVVTSCGVGGVHQHNAHFPQRLMLKVQSFRRHSDHIASYLVRSGYLPEQGPEVSYSMEPVRLGYFVDRGMSLF